MALDALCGHFGRVSAGCPQQQRPPGLRRAPRVLQATNTARLLQEYYDSGHAHPSIPLLIVSIIFSSAAFSTALGGRALPLEVVVHSRALRRAGLPPLRSHDLRHMAETLMHQAEGTAKSDSRNPRAIVGWDHYIHLRDSMRSPHDSSEFVCKMHGVEIGF